MSAGGDMGNEQSDLCAACAPKSVRPESTGMKGVAARAILIEVRDRQNCIFDVCAQGSRSSTAVRSLAVFIQSPASPMCRGCSPSLQGGGACKKREGV